jgi:CDP-glycerol glycerophosphotransferase (TagB/SpsB family)
MPLKRIGCLDNKGPYYMDNSHILIATSEIFQDLIAQSFNRPFKDVLIIGQPRNDLMFEPTDFYDTFSINRSDYNSIGIWLPTYRASIEGDIRVDGNYSEEKISFLDIDNLKELDQFLVKKNNLLIIKIHPMDKIQDLKFCPFSNIIIIKPRNFKCQLYPLLGSTDYLLTDYSSVWVDYELLNKPMGFVIDDFEVYKESRGFTIPDILEQLPGKIITNIDELKNFIDNPQKYIVDSHDKFNKFKDNKSSERLVSHLRNLELF